MFFIRYRLSISSIWGDLMTAISTTLKLIKKWTEMNSAWTCWGQTLLWTQRINPNQTRVYLHNVVWHTSVLPTLILCKKKNSHGDLSVWSKWSKTQKKTFNIINNFYKGNCEKWSNLLQDEKAL